MVPSDVMGQDPQPDAAGSDDLSDFGDFEAPSLPNPVQQHLPTPQALPTNSSSSLSPPAFTERATPDPESSLGTAAVPVSAGQEAALKEEEEEEEDDWGDFDEAEFQAAPPVQAETSTPLPMATFTAAPPATTPQTAEEEDDFGDFGDFEDAPTPVAMPLTVAPVVSGGVGVGLARAVVSEGGLAHEEKAAETTGNALDWMQVRLSTYSTLSSAAEM